MSWRKLAGAVMFSPILIGLLVFVALLVVWKLPMICCERRRAVRYLPWAGLAYYGVLVPLMAWALPLAWWEVLIGVGLFALGGDWLLPDPFTFLFRRRKRLAVRQAIEYLEAEGGPPVIYGMVSVVGSEAGRTIVSLPTKSGTIPPARRFLAVPDRAAPIEELDFEDVSTRYGAHACL